MSYQRKGSSIKNLISVIAILNKSIFLPALFFIGVVLCNIVVQIIYLYCVSVYMRLCARMCIWQNLFVISGYTFQRISYHAWFLPHSISIIVKRNRLDIVKLKGKLKQYEYKKQMTDQKILIWRKTEHTIKANTSNEF